MTWLALVSAVVIGVVVNECCDLSPWAALEIVRVAARWWAADEEHREVYVEAWAAVIDDCPGKVTKLALAVLFLIGGAGRWVARWWSLSLQRALAPVEPATQEIAAEDALGRWLDTIYRSGLPEHHKPAIAMGAVTDYYLCRFGKRIGAGRP